MPKKSTTPKKSTPKAKAPKQATAAPVTGCACKKWFFPSTCQGRLSFMMFELFAAFFLIAQIVVAYGVTGGETIFDSPGIAVPMLLAGFCVIAALILGLIAVFKERERSIPTFLIILFGLFVVLLLIGEFTVME